MASSKCPASQARSAALAKDACCVCLSRTRIEFIEQEITEQLVVSISPTGFGVIERMDEQISPHHGVDNGLNVSHRLVFQIAGGHFRIDGFKDRRSNQKVPGGLIQTGKTASEK
jgi:hypothetical protein